MAGVRVRETAVDHSWVQDGQWQGVFASKQSRGFLAAYLMFFALCRKLCGDSWLICGAMFRAAAACVIGSGSRGGGALALVSLGLPGDAQGGSTMGAPPTLGSTALVPPRG